MPRPRRARSRHPPERPRHRRSRARFGPRHRAAKGVGADSQARDAARLARHDVGARGSRGRDDGVGGEIAGPPEVFAQRAPQQGLVEQRGRGLEGRLSLSGLGGPRLRRLRFEAQPEAAALLGGIRLGEIAPVVAAAALLALERGTRHQAAASTRLRASPPRSSSSRHSSRRVSACCRPPRSRIRPTWLHIWSRSAGTTSLSPAPRRAAGG